MVDKIPAFRELTKKQTMIHVSHTFSLMKGEDGLPWKTALYRPYPDYSVGWRIRRTIPGHVEGMSSREKGNTRHGGPLILEERRPNTRLAKSENNEKTHGLEQGEVVEIAGDGMELARQAFLSRGENFGVRGGSWRP